MPSPSFTLYAQLRFHDKWLKIDLQVCVDELMHVGTLWVIWRECSLFFLAPCYSEELEKLQMLDSIFSSIPHFLYRLV